jgi:hypothetical protein
VKSGLAGESIRLRALVDTNCCAVNRDIVLVHDVIIMVIVSRGIVVKNTDSSAGVIENAEVQKRER